MRKIKNIFYYLLLSFIAVLLILIMIFLKPDTSNTTSFLDKVFVSFAFFASCVFGISIAIYPSWWRKNKQNTDHISEIQPSKKSRSFQGHHPDCSMFSSHVIIIKNKARCAGCLGLIIGALASICLMILYLIFNIKFPTVMNYFILIFGILLLIFVYGEIIISKRNMFFHILLNCLLILTFFVITISVFELTKNPVYGLIAVIFCFLWLDTRIHISNYQHQRICASCAQECKSY